MRFNEPLRELISSLSRTEKRYVKLSSVAYSRKQESIYIKLFDLIDSGKQDDEIKKVLGKKYGRQLSRVKNYLYEQIMRSMQQYHHKLSVANRLNSLFADIEFLMHKGLYAQAEKVVGNARQIAEKYEFFEDLHKIYLLEARLRFRSGNQDKETNIQARLSAVLGRLENENHYFEPYLKLMSFETKSSTRRSPEIEEGMVSQLKTEVFKDIDHAKSFEAKRRLYECRIRYGYLSHNYEDALENSYNLVKLHEDRPEQIEKNPHGYLGNAMMHLLLSQRYMSMHNEVFRTCDKVKMLAKGDIYKKDIKLQADTLFYTFSMELGSLIELGRIEKIEIAARQLEEVILKYERFILPSNRITTWINLAHASFILGDYSTTIRRLNKMFAMWGKIKLRVDVFIVGKMLNLMVHYELGNITHLPYAVKSVLYFLKKNGRASILEREILRTVNKFASIDNSVQQEELLKEFYKRLEALDDPYSKSFLNQLLLSQWLESKIQKRPLYEVVAERKAWN